MPEHYEVTDAVYDAFVFHWFFLDEAESTEECAGFSRFVEYDKSEVYSFAVVDDKGIQVYSRHDRFAELAKGVYEGCECDGAGHLTVSVPDPKNAPALNSALHRLDAAVGKFFRPQVTL